MAGIQGAAQKPTNLSKTTEVLWGSKEHLRVFLKQLQKIFKMYTAFDPWAPFNVRTLNLACHSINPGHPKTKLPKLEDFAGINTSQLIRVAPEVYNSPNTKRQKQAAL